MSENHNDNISGETNTFNTSVVKNIKTKGTGYLRSNAPKLKKAEADVPFIPNEIEAPKPISIDEMNETPVKPVKNKKQTPSILAPVKKVFTKPNPNKTLADTQPDVVEQKDNASNEVKTVSVTTEITENNQNTEIKKPNQNMQKKRLIHKGNPNQNTNQSNNGNNANLSNTNYNPTYSSKNNKPYRNEQQRNHSHYDKDEVGLEVITEHQPVDKVLSLIRQRGGFIPSKFWEKFNEIEKETPLNLEVDAKQLVLNAVLFNKEEIYQDLLEKYSNHLKEADFEGHLITYCANKPSIFLDKTINFYSGNMPNKERLADILINKLTSCSFREENNFIWLSWLDRQSTPEQLNQFWKTAFECNNTVLLKEALNFKNLHKYLKDHQSDFESEIEGSISKYHINKLLNEPSFHVDRSNQLQSLMENSEHENKSFQNALSTLFKTDKENKSEKRNADKSENSTEVIVKKNRLTS